MRWLPIAVGFALAVGGLAAAWADDPPSTSAPGASGNQAIGMAEFCGERRHARRYYPQEAMRRGIEGRAQLDCSLNADSSLAACVVSEESPQHFGFGEAALKVACEHPPDHSTSDDEEGPIYYTPAGSEARYVRWTVHFSMRGDSSLAPPGARRVQAFVTTCENFDGRASDEEVVRACTRVIRDEMATTAGTAQAYGHRAEAYYRAGSYDLAIADYTFMARLDPTDPSAYYNLALVNHAKGDVEGALTNYDRAVDLGLSSADVFAGRCRAHLIARHMSEARADCRHALTIRPENVVALSGLGLIQLMQGDYQGAWTSYDSALRLEPHDPYHLYGRGVAAMHLRRTEEASADIEAAHQGGRAVEQWYAGYGVVPPQ